MENIKITMLGASGAGKTCFMVGMYAIVRQGVKGFTFTTADLDDDLDLSNSWAQMVEAQDMERWPKPTAESKPYSFKFNYGLKEMVGFDWMDYRGGALKDRSTAQDVQELMAHLQASSCVFLCVSGEYLIESITGREAAIRSRASIDRMLQFLQKLPSFVQRPAVVIVITKYDKVLSRGRRKEDMINDIKSLFNPLFVDASGWLVMISPVTLGKELSENPQSGEIAPINIHLPVTFSVYFAFKQEVGRLQDQRQEVDELLRANSDNWFARVFNKGSNLEKQKEIGKYGVMIGEGEERMKLLVRELIGAASIYYEGREVKLDV